MATNDNTAELMMLFKAQNKDVLTKLNQIDRQTKKSFSKSAKSVKEFNLTMQKGAGLAKTFATSLAGFGGVAIGGSGLGLATLIQTVSSGIAEVAAEAKRAGISFEAFQELQFATAKSKVSVDALTDGLKEMQLRADEYITTGSGSGADAFKRLGYTASDLKEKLKEPDQLFEDIIGKLQQLDKAAQIRVADEVFGGTGGEQFVQLLDQGVSGLREGRIEARRLGIVMSNDLAVKAQELDQKFKQIQTTIGTGLKTAVVDVGSQLDQWGVPDKLMQDIASLKALFSNPSVSNLEAALGMPLWGGGVDSKDVAKIALKRKLLAGQTGDFSNWNDLFTERYGDQVTNDNLPSVVPIPPKAKTPKRDTNTIKDRIAALKAEYDAIGQSAEQQRLMNELRAAGSDATSAQKQQIEDYVLSIDKASKRQESMNYLTQQFQSAGMNAFSEVTDQINTGNKALDGFLQSLAQASMQALVFGSGPMAGLFGGGGLFGGIASLFGGFFADGGYLGAGKWGIAGEAGAEVIKGPATVVPSSRQSSAQNTVVQVVPSDMFEVVMDKRAGAVVNSASGSIVSTAVGVANQTAPAAMAQHQMLGGGDWRNAG